MATATGYSGTPLPRKLGIAVGSRVLLDGAPDVFVLEPMPDEVTLHVRPAGGSYDVIVCFCPDLRRLRRRFTPLARRLTTAGALWICWPKKASGVATDLDENVLRDVGLEGGLVDVKVCAVDEVWSGLKFVVRLRDR